MLVGCDLLEPHSYAGYERFDALPTPYSNKKLLMSVSILAVPPVAAHANALAMYIKTTESLARR